MEMLISVHRLLYFFLYLNIIIIVFNVFFFFVHFVYGTEDEAECLG